jgi:hypothetical protein
VLQESNVLLLLEAIADESPFMPGKLAEFIGLNKVIWALSPAEKSETRRILGADYPYQCQADAESEILKQLFLLYHKWETSIEMRLDQPALSNYVSPKHVVDELELILEEL